MKITIKVTKEVLEKTKMCISGDTSTATNCALSYATREIFPFAHVHKKQIVVANKIHGNVYLSELRRFGYPEIALPVEATNFIAEFDASTPEQRSQMQPFSFDVEIPSEVIDKIGIGQVYKILSESKTLELTMKQ